MTLAMRTAAQDGSSKSKDARKWRSPRPRNERVSISLARRTIRIAAVLAVLALSLSFALGFVVGRSAEEPLAKTESREQLVESPPPAPAVVERDVAFKAAAEAPPPEAKPETKTDPAPAKPPEPELDIRVGRVNRPGFGIQIGAFPDVDTARDYLLARARDLKGQKIYLIPTAIEGRGVWHRARVGLFESKKDAEAAKRKLPEAIAKDAIVVSYR